MTTPQTVFLLDAYALIFRAYYAFIRAPRRDSQGRDVSAVFGFALSLQDLLDKYNPDYIAVAFDPPGGTFRHREYPEYKAQREATPEGIKLAVPFIKEMLSAYRIPILEVPDFEADDVIGTLAKQASAAGYRVMMVTPDKDYGQLVDDKCRILKPAMSGGYEEMGPEEVCKKFNIASTDQVIDYLGLVGDSADNIPGCKGVGPKGAEKLLAEYGTVEEIIAHADEIAGANGKKIRKQIEQIKISKYLARIRCDVPVQFDAQAFVREAPQLEPLMALFEELQFRTLAKRVLEGQSAPAPAPAAAPAPKAAPAPDNALMGDLFDPAPVAADSSTPAAGEASLATFSQLNTLANTPHDYHYVESDKEFDWLVERLTRAQAFAFDTETTDLDALRAEVVALSFAINEHEAYCVPMPQDRQACQERLMHLQPLFQHTDILKIGQNIKYDMQVLLNYGIEVKAPYFDTMVAHYLLWPDQRHSMDLMAEQLLQYRTITFDELTANLPKNKQGVPDLWQADPEALCNYAAEDADITIQLYHQLKTRLESDDLMGLMTKVEMPLVTVLMQMERAGVMLDTTVLHRLEKELEKELQEIEQRIYEMAGDSFNINSSKQVGEVLFERLQVMKKPKKTKGGSYSTSEEVLEQIADLHPIIPTILDYRGTKKLLSTYVSPLPDMRYPDGKLHSTFNQAVAATGRLSSSNPNLQNIPIRTERGRLIREAFVPDTPESLFLSADYSQIELRLMAHLSGDESMIADFVAGRDVHRATAAKVFKVADDQVTSDMRRKAKTANFGIIYGISAFGLSQRLNIPRGEAASLIEGYFVSYPAIKAYMDQAIAEAKERGYVSTLMGRRRYLEGINSQNRVVRGNAERNAINAPIQGTAADIIKVAMNNIYEQIQAHGLRSRLILQVHDELNFNVVPDELEVMQTIVRQGMETAMPGLRVPLVAEMGVGKNWLEAH